MIAGREKIAEYFEKLLEKHGDHYLALDWKSKESQLIRFSVLLDIIAFTDKRENISILDVGCGIGHFYEFLKENNLLNSLKVKYTGIDISKKMVEFSRKKFPGVRFETVDLVNDKFTEKFDYVICSGVFNIKMEDMDAHKASVRQMISRMFNICNVGVAANFLAQSNIYIMPPEDEENRDRYVFYTEEELAQWIKAVCERYILRKDYHPGDFTFYMLK